MQWYFRRVRSKDLSSEATVPPDPPIIDGAPSVQTRNSLVSLIADFLDMISLPQICLTIWFFHAVNEDQ